ncbi:MAG: IPT/TIG domain-containing protein [Puniceicoccaceae bacterium]
MKPTLFLCLVSLVFLAGCGVTLRNRTPSRIPENPSGIYTISVEARVSDASVNSRSMESKIVIDGNTYSMEPNPLVPDLFDFDYVMPQGQSEAAFYFIVEYDQNQTGRKRRRSQSSQLHNFQLINRYPIKMQFDRAPVGKEVPILGRGFRETDTILIAGFEADTKFRSGNEISFTVPPLRSGVTYPISLRSGNDVVPVGSFVIDPSILRVNPTAIDISSGETVVLLFSVDFEAPSSGLILDVATNIPRSVIMPEVVIRGGTRSVSVPVQGGDPGRGALFITVPGMKEVTIPVTVR